MTRISRARILSLMRIKDLAERLSMVSSGNERRKAPRIKHSISQAAMRPLKPVSESPVTSTRSLRFAAMQASNCTSRKLSVSALVVSPGAGEKRKKMPVRERLGRDKRIAFFEQGFALSRESPHDVRADRRVRQAIPDQAKFFRIMPRPVTPVHGAQNRVRSRLQGQMGVARDPARRIAEKLQQGRRPVHGFNGA